MLESTTMLQAMIGGLGVWELVIILLIVLVFVGGRKLPELAGSLGKSVRTFKRSMAGNDEEPVDVTPTPALEEGTAAAQTVEVETAESEQSA